MRGRLLKLRGQIGAARAHGTSSMWSMVEYFSYPLMMFLATPFFLNWLGEVQYGQWMLLLTFNGLGGLAGLGMGTAATRDVAAARGRNDPDEALAAVRACLSVTLLSSTLLVSALVLFGMLAGGDLLARVGEPDLIRTIIVIAAMLILLEQLDTVFAGMLRGMERFDLSARVEPLTKMGLVLLSLAAAYLTQNIFWVFAAAVTMTVVRLVIKATVASHLLGGVPWPTWDRQRMKSVFSFGKWTWAQAVGAAIFSSADRLLVGGLLGSEALARYSICLQLAQQVQTVPAAAAQFLFPAVSKRKEQGQNYRALAIKASVLIGAFAITLAIGLALIAKPLLTIWVGAEIAASSASILALLAFAFATLAINVGPHYVLLGAGEARTVAVLNLIAGMVSLAIIPFLVPKLGLAGAAWARFAYAVVISFSLFSMFRALNIIPKEKV